MVELNKEVMGDEIKSSSLLQKFIKVSLNRLEQLNPLKTLLCH